MSHFLDKPFLQYNLLRLLLFLACLFTICFLLSRDGDGPGPVDCPGLLPPDVRWESRVLKNAPDWYSAFQARKGGGDDSVHHQDRKHHFSMRSKHRKDGDARKQTPKGKNLVYCMPDKSFLGVTLYIHSFSYMFQSFQTCISQLFFHPWELYHQFL